MPTIWSIDQHPHLWHPQQGKNTAICIHRLMDRQGSSVRRHLQDSRAFNVRASPRCIRTCAQDGDGAKRKQKPRSRNPRAPLLGAAALAAKYQRLLQQSNLANPPASSDEASPKQTAIQSEVIAESDVSQTQASRTDDSTGKASSRAKISQQAADVPTEQQIPQVISEADRFSSPKVEASPGPPSISITQLKKSYPWLLSDKGEMDQSEWDLRVKYAQLLYSSLDLLVEYDISSLDGRAAPLQRNPAVIEPSLSVRLQARQEQELRAAANTALVTALFPEQMQPHPVLPSSVGPGSGSMVQDGRWARRLGEHDSYLQYMKQLYNVLVPQTQTSKQPSSKQKRSTRVDQSLPASSRAPILNLDPQLMYQVGICEDWIQLSHLLATFLPYTGPGTVVAVYKQLCSVLSQPRVTGWGPTERQAFSLFTARLAQRATAVMSDMGHVELCWVAYGAAVLESYQTGRPYDGLSVLPATYSYGAHLNRINETTENHRNSDAEAGSQDQVTESAQVDQGTVNLAYHPVVRERITSVASLFYTSCNRAQQLLDSSASSSNTSSTTKRPVQSNDQQLSTSGGSKLPPLKAQSVGSAADAQQQATSSDAPNLQLSELDVPTTDAAAGGSGPQAGQGPSSTPQDEWTATQYSQLTWALGMIGYRPPPALVRLIIRYTERRLERFQPAQQWALLWGMARLSGSPAFPKLPARWISRFYAASQRIIGDYDGEGLVHLVWSAAILRSTQQYLPDKEWSRAVCGAAAAKSRSLTGPYMVALIEGLTLLGYVPRPEVSRVLLEQARRYLHTLTAQQLATLIKSTAVQTRWQPPRPFLYDWVRSAGKLMRTFRPSYVAASMWSLATLGYTPEDGMWRAMLQAVAVRGFTLCSASDLSQAIWAVATLKAGYRLNKFYVESAWSYLPVASASGIISQQGNTISRDEEALLALQAAEQAQAPSQSASTDRDTGTTSTDNTTSMKAVSSLAQDYGSGVTSQDATMTSGLSSETVVKVPREVLWMEGWLEAAARKMHSFKGSDVAFSVWALGKISAQPSETLLQAFLEQAECLLPDMTTQELSHLVHGLALMRYRPCDAWLEAFVQHLEPRLPECGATDIGYLAWSLASVGTPVTEEFLRAMARECSRQWASTTGDGLGHLVWALGQYSYSPYSKPPPENPSVAEQRGQNPWQAQPSRKESQWWQGYYSSCAQKWVGTSSKALVLMLFGTAGTVRTPPPRDWQLELLRAIRMTVPKPKHEGDVLYVLFEEAGLHSGGRVVDVVQPGTSARTARADHSNGMRDVDKSTNAHGYEDVSGSAMPQVQRDPVPLLDQDPYFQALVQQDLSLRVLIPPRALNSLWLAVWLGELRVRWGFDRAPALWVPETD